MKRNYQLVVIFEPEVKAEEKEKLLQNIKKIISEKGKVKEEKEWGKKELAYPIRKQRMGIFYWFSFEGEPMVLVNLNKKLKIEDKILRFLIVLAKE